MPAEVLVQARARVQAGDPAVQPALDTLRARAEAALAQPVVTVLDKDLTAPSGDKQDYLTRAIYFWPNPDTPDGLPYVKRDGVVYEENRSGTDFLQRKQMEDTVLTLALAYYLTDEARYAEHAVRQLRAWFIDPATRMNPHLRYGQGVPGIMDGSEWGTIDNWRWPWLLDAVRLLEPSEAWTEADQAALETWMLQYADWLETGEPGYHAGLMWNNHGVYYDAQRAAIALFARDEERARTILRDAWHRRIDHGIEGDGRQRYELERTRSFGYSTFTLQGFFVLAALAEHAGVDLWRHTAPDGSGIRPALDFLAYHADTTHVWPYEDLAYRPAELIPLLRWAAVAYDAPAYAEAARALPGYAEAAQRPARRLVHLYQLFQDS